jgi:hypothetical protein
MLPGLFVGAILSLPGIVPALLLTWNEPPELVARANHIYVFYRLPHHLAPLTLPTEELARRLGGHTALVLLLTAFVLALHRISATAPTGGMGATGSASASPPHHHSRPATSQQLEAPLQLLPLTRIAQFAWGALLLAAIGFVIEIVLWDDTLAAAKVLRYYWFRLTDFALPAAAALYATCFITLGLREKRAWAIWALDAALIVAGWNIIHTTYERDVSRLPPADQKVRDFGSWCDACEWAAENTPHDALFLTPRLNLTFKWRAGRPEVVNRKDLPQDARSIVEWHRRIQDIYYATIEGELQPLDSLGVLGSERVRDIARQYGAAYVIMDRGQLLQLPIAYINDEYVIYRIDGDDARTTPET